MKKFDIVYIVSDKTKNNHFDLRFSIRSVQKYLSQQVNDIYIVGYKPKWIKDVKHIPAKDSFQFKSTNIINKILLACKNQNISQNFLLMADDYIITKSFNIQEMPQYYYNSPSTYNQKIKHIYMLMVRSTFKILKQKFNISDPKRFDKHYPTLINKKMCIQTMNRFDWKKRKLIFKIIYCNLNQYNPYQLKDNKMRRSDKDLSKQQFLDRYVNDKDKICFSTRSKIPQNITKYIMQIYPEKSKFQK